MIDSTHLTEEELLELLDEPATADTQLVHLAGCAECRLEFTALRDSLADFRHALTGMAFAQTHRRVAPEGRRSSAQHHVVRRYVWSASLATAMVLLATALSVVRPGHDAPAAPAPDVAREVSAPVSDDALLESIQLDLSTSIPPSLEPLAVPAAPGATRTSN